MFGLQYSTASKEVRENEESPAEESEEEDRLNDVAEAGLENLQNARLKNATATTRKMREFSAVDRFTIGDDNRSIFEFPIWMIFADRIYKG